MIRVIWGTILGYFLSGIINNLIGDTDFYYSSFYGDRFTTIITFICALIGGYIGSKFNQYYIKQVRIGRVLNKNALYAGKSAVVLVTLFIFTLLMSDSSGAKGIEYVYLLSCVFLVLSIYFGVKSFIEINKTKEIGIFYSVLAVVIPLVFLIMWFGLLPI